MNRELSNFPQADKLDKHFSRDLEINESEVLQSDGFDLSAFFGDENEDNHEKDLTKKDLSTDTVNASEVVNKPIPDLLLTLRDDANESITTITTKVTEETFAQGASITSSVFSALGSLVGSCGVFCAHTLGSLGQVGAGLSGAPVLGGINMPGFNVDKSGNFHLDGNINSLSKMTGISASDLLMGNFSAEDILTAFISIFGESVSHIFGFGLVQMLMGCMFDCFLPNTGEINELSRAA